MSDLHNAMQGVLTRWSMGRSGASAAPDDIRARLSQDEEEAELQLLALGGQALGMLAIPSPDGPLIAVSDIPKLGVPSIPDRHRPVVRRVLSTSHQWLRNGLLDLLERRGYSVHPGDWMPSKSSDVPQLYAPWQDWMEGMGGEAPEEVTLSNWDEHGPARRKAILLRMRGDNPGLARTIIEAKAGGENAEKRHAIISVLSQGLSIEDKDYLETLLRDRAPRIRTLASGLLSRLGIHSQDQENSREIDDFFVMETKGILRKTKALAYKPIKNHAQRSRRMEVLERMDLHTLSGALGVNDSELPALWPWKEDLGMDLAFVSLIVNTAATEVVETFEAEVRKGSVEIHAVTHALHLLSPDTLNRVAERNLRKESGFAQTVSALEGRFQLGDPMKTEAWKAVLKGMEVHSDHPKVYTDDLLGLGIVVSSENARAIVDALVAKGFSSADPRMDTLRLNAAL